MNLISEGPLIRISLSRRNLLTLLKMLDQKVGMPVLKRRVSPTVGLFVTAEEDEQHYASADRRTEHRGQFGIGPDDI